MKIKEKKCRRIVSSFVIKVAARSAADIWGIHPNSEVLFYCKIRMVISHHYGLGCR